MKITRTPAWAELVQLLPVLSLAFPFILQGSVDIGRAASGFLLGALLALPVSALVLARGHVLNPILVGTDLWLGLGALAFHLPLPGVVAWLRETQAFGLFVAAFGTGLASTVFSRHGFIGCTSDERAWIRRASYLLLSASLGAAVWAYAFRADVRLGGGLPFIALNVTRRVLIARATPRPSARAGSLRI